MYSSAAILFLLAGVVTAAELPARPRFPPIFNSEWLWYQTYVDGVGPKGPCKWASNGTVMYVNMTAVAIEQLVVGDTFWQWHSGTQKCEGSSHGYNLIDHWFDNTTFAGYASNNKSAIWIGSLGMSHGQLSNFVVHSDKDNGYFGPKYIAANIYRDSNNRPGSEVNDLRHMDFVLPSGSEPWFILPDFCK